MGLKPKFAHKPSILPKKLQLIGHAKTFDTYESPRGNLFRYSGSNIQDFNNKKFWKRVK